MRRLGKISVHAKASKFFEIFLAIYTPVGVWLSGQSKRINSFATVELKGSRVNFLFVCKMLQRV
jgi:hypothetical protein